jgi:hypothetical protein
MFYLKRQVGSFTAQGFNMVSSDQLIFFNKVILGGIYKPKALLTYRPTGLLTISVVRVCDYLLRDFFPGGNSSLQVGD